MQQLNISIDDLDVHEIKEGANTCCTHVYYNKTMGRWFLYMRPIDNGLNEEFVSNLQAIDQYIKENSKPCEPAEIYQHAIVAAPYEDNYYRASILSINGNEACLGFIDFGNKEMIPLRQLRQLSPKFLKFSRHAQSVRLMGVQMDKESENAINYLKSCEEDSVQLRCVRIQPNNVGVLEYKFMNEKTNECINTLIEKYIREDFPVNRDGVFESV